MEPPATFEADALRDEKVKVLRAIAPMTPDEVRVDVVRGQYGPGWVAAQQVPGYREEPEVDPESETETFVAARFEIDDWRWAGVPFYLRTGKRLPKRATEIAIQFRPVPHRLFKDSSVDPEPNLLALRIQPDEGILLRFGAKVPGLGLDVRAVNMDFTYGSAFNVDSPDAYETLILDALLGDASLFTRADEVEEAWSIVTPIIEAWLDMPRPGVPELRGRLVGPGRGRRADGPRRPTLAADLMTGRPTTPRTRRPAEPIPALDVAGRDDRRDRARAGQDLGGPGPDRRPSTARMPATSRPGRA